MKQLGAEGADVVLYLENKPVVTEGQLDVPQLIAENGNHWRKILSILAKLCSDDDWRNYRDRVLLQHSELLVFDGVERLAKVQIYSGKACWQRFGFDEGYLAQLEQTACGRAYIARSETGLTLFTPYLDYRQFPNALVDQLRPQIARALHLY